MSDNSGIAWTNATWNVENCNGKPKLKKWLAMIGIFCGGAIT